MKHPISAITWIDRARLSANDYNPNRQATPELMLLKQSILETGWTQPIVATPELTIIDGFHRWTVAGMPEVVEKYGADVPVVVVRGKSRSDLMMDTIRHNRARGTHGVLPMADIVCELVQEGVTEDDFALRLGMEAEEVDRLSDKAGMRVRGTRGHDGFKRAWVPQAPKG